MRDVNVIPIRLWPLSKAILFFSPTENAVESAGRASLELSHRPTVCTPPLPCEASNITVKLGAVEGRTSQYAVVHT